MARVKVSIYGKTSCQVRIIELPYPQNTYDDFKIECNNNEEKIPISSSSSDETSSLEIYGLEPGTRYTVNGWTKRGGDNWQSVSSDIFTTDDEVPVPSLPTSVNIDVDGRDIEVTWVKGDNAYWTCYSYSWESGQYTKTDEIFTAKAPSYDSKYSVQLWSMASDGTLSEGSILKSFWTDEKPLPPRPSNFNWSTPKVAGQDFNLTALEWRNFTSKINDFREYKGLNLVTFSYADQSEPFTAAMFNNAKNAIYDMNPTSGYPTVKESGDIVRADDLNIIVNKLNSIS